MNTEWFKRRRYKHFDFPVGRTFAENAMLPDFVKRHPFSPLIHYIKQTKRYNIEEGKTPFKDRPIMYSSHRDACILSYYSFQLNCLLDDFYRKNNLDDCVIAYRTLGQANYDFSAEAYRFAVEHAPFWHLMLPDFSTTLTTRF